MKEATSTRDISSNREKCRALKKRTIHSNAIIETIKEKEYDHLSSKEKDDLLKALAIRFGMISS